MKNKWIIVGMWKRRCIFSKAATKEPYTRRKIRAAKRRGKKEKASLCVKSKRSADLFQKAFRRVGYTRSRPFVAYPCLCEHTWIKRGRDTAVERVSILRFKGKRVCGWKEKKMVAVWKLRLWNGFFVRVCIQTRCVSVFVYVWRRIYW